MVGHSVLKYIVAPGTASLEVNAPITYTQDYGTYAPATAYVPPWETAQSQQDGAAESIESIKSVIETGVIFGDGIIKVNLTLENRWNGETVQYFLYNYGDRIRFFGLNKINKYISAFSDQKNFDILAQLSEFSKSNYAVGTSVLPLSKLLSDERLAYVPEQASGDYLLFSGIEEKFSFSLPSADKPVLVNANFIVLGSEGEVLANGPMPILVPSVLK